jgi:hypothetical protein
MFGDAIAKMIHKHALEMSALDENHVKHVIEIRTEHDNEIHELNEDHIRVICNLKTEHVAEKIKIEFNAARKLNDRDTELDMQVAENFLMQNRIRYLEAVAENFKRDNDALRDRLGVLDGHLRGMQAFGEF